jgi:hypothetical protein
VRGWVAARRWHLALAAVAIAYSAVQLIFTARIGLGWDESVYVSQVAHGVPPATFSAPRARGVPLLVAPVALFTASVTAVRVYLSVLSGVGLFLAYLPWLKVRDSVLVPVAAGLFASLWLSLFYGNEAMPNLWVAFSGVAGAGLFRLARDTGPRADGTRPVRAPLVLAGLVAAFALASLTRPTDASWLALPLIVYGLYRRRFGAVIAIAAGLAIGWGEWITEAYLRYGGPLTRLKAAGAENESGLHFSLGAHLRALDGPLLCRYGSPCGGYPPAQVAWFAAIPVLAVLGVWAVRRRGLGLALASGLSITGSYVLTVGYAAPRFLLPAYALLALPVAGGISLLWRSRLARVPVVAGVLAFVAVQAVTLAHWTTLELGGRAADAITVSGLRAMGMRTPCFLYGHDAVQVGYLAGCSSWGIISNYGGAATPASIRGATARHEWVAVIGTRRRPAPFLASWTRTPLNVNHAKPWYLFLPPAR